MKQAIATYHHVILGMIVNRFIVHTLYRVHWYLVGSLFCADPELILL